MRMACTVAMASTAPAAPSKCPIMLFVLLILKFFPGRAFVMAWYSAMSPAGTNRQVSGSRTTWSYQGGMVCWVRI